MNLPQNEWSEKLQSDPEAIILDVRTDEEFQEGFIPGALHMDIYEGQGFIDRIKELDTAKNYYVYCKAGSRSAQACALMSQLGFPNSYNLAGGFSQWTGQVDFPGNN